MATDFKPEFNFYPLTIEASFSDTSLENPQPNSPNVPFAASSITETGGGGVVSKDIKSSNYVPNVAGYMFGLDGIIRALGLDIGGASTIAGWNVNATSIYTGTEDHSGYTANAGDVTLYSDGTDSSIHTYNWYIGTDGIFHTRSGDMTGVSIAGIPNDTSTDISLLEATHDLVFSVTDKDTVAWATGTITLSNARTFSITGSNTGNMAARTYIYLDTGVSSTALQTTTTVSTAMGANKKLIAVAQNGSAQAQYTVYGGIGGIKLPASGTSVSNNNWTYSGTWSVTDLDTVAWGAGTLTTSDGGSYSITGSNTGNMSAKTYIYFDLGISSTAFQTTTTAATSIGDGKILIAIAQNGTGEANYLVVNDKQSNIDAAQIVAGSITANEIAANTITATKMDVSQLSAIAADLGTITAGTVTGATIQTASSGTRFVMTSTSFQGINSVGTVIFEVIISGGDAGDVIMGDDATGKYAKWDNSAATFAIYGTVLADSPVTYTLTAGEAISNNDSVQLGYDVLANSKIPSDDSYTDQSSSSSNFGSGVLINLKNPDGGAAQLGWIKFSFSDVPSTNLTAATLYFKTGSNAGETTTFKRVTGADWAEGTITYTNQPAVGDTVGSVATPSTSTVYSIDCTTQVQNWLSGAHSNYGLRIENNSNSTVDVHSSEAGGSNEPYLVLTYSNGKIFKASAINSTNTARWLGFAREAISSDATGLVQLDGIDTLSGLTQNSIYYLSNTRGAIATSAGTVSKKVGLALSTTSFFIDKSS